MTKYWAICCSLTPCWNDEPLSSFYLITLSKNRRVVVALRSRTRCLECLSCLRWAVCCRLLFTTMSGELGAKPWTKQGICGWLMRIISCLTAPGWWRLMKQTYKDRYKEQLQNNSSTNVNTLWVLCRIAPLSLTFTSVTLCRLKRFLGVYECTLPLADFFSLPLPLRLHWPSQAPCCSSNTFSLTHRLSASGCQPAFFSLCWHRWTIAVDYSVAPFCTFLIHLHDSIYLPGKRELFLDFRHREHFCVFTVLLAWGSFLWKNILWH